MTELLHPVRPGRATTTASSELGTVTPQAGAADDAPALVPRAPRHERDRAMLDEAVTPEELPALSTRQLRVMVNQAYKLTDVDYPPAGALDRYVMLVEELELRAQQAAGRGSGTGSVHHIKEGFRDNPLYCRFEFFIDGDLAAYMRYRINGGQVILFDGVEQPSFRGQGLDVPLMRHIVLNTHKRRLGLIPRCPMALSFLADNPQYELLTAQSRH